MTSGGGALRALLRGIVDYAGLFPPASLDVHAAARNYHTYRASPDRWMLGRFVVGVAKLPELRATIATLHKKDDGAWPLSVVAPDAAAATAILRAADDATEHPRSACHHHRAARDIEHRIGGSGGRVRHLGPAIMRLSWRDRAWWLKERREPAPR